MSHGIMFILCNKNKYFLLNFPQANKLFFNDLEIWISLTVL